MLTSNVSLTQPGQTRASSTSDMIDIGFRQLADIEGTESFPKQKCSILKHLSRTRHIHERQRER